MVYAINIALVLASVWFAVSVVLLVGALVVRSSPTLMQQMRAELSDASDEEFNRLYSPDFYVFVVHHCLFAPTAVVGALVLARMAVR